MATFDFSGEEIIVIGNENTAFSPNSGTDSVKMELETPDTSLKIGVILGAMLREFSVRYAVSSV